MTILLLAGSPSSPSRSTRLLQYTGEQLALLGHRTHQLQVRDLPATALVQADFGHAGLIAARALVADADALVIATPVYKAAYSGVLKAFLDLLPQDGLKGKLVLPLATGGSQSHMLALDYALRPVLSALGARHVLPSVYATDAQVLWTADEGLALDADIARRINEGVETLAEYLPVRLAAALAPHAIHLSQVRCSA
jgi:FMN reductase